VVRGSVSHSDQHSDVFRSLFDRLGVCMASLDATLRVQEGNGDFYREFRRSSSDACGRSFFDFVHQSGHLPLQHQFAGLKEGLRARFTERVLALRSGEVAFPSELTGLAAFGEDGGVAAVMVIVRPEEADAGRVGAGRMGADRKKILSELDARILEGVAAGVSTVQLASRLYLSRGGIEYHVGSMMRQLKAPNRAAMVSKAYSMGVLSMGAWPPRVVPEFVND
jgi:DNA-binding CsgD family transcriptional regulator